MFDETMIDHTLGFWVNRAGYLMRLELTDRFAATGVDLTGEEFAILNRVWTAQQRTGEGPSHKEIADGTMKDKTTVTRFIDKLVAKGFLERRRDPRDGRTVRIYLTRTGERVRGNIVPVAQGLIKDATQGIPPEDLEATMRCLKKITENMISAEEPETQESRT